MSAASLSLCVIGRCAQRSAVGRADEMTELGFDNRIPKQFAWSKLSSKSGDDLEVHYRHTLDNLGKVPGLVGIIFRKAQNKISPPSLQLRRPGNPSDRSAASLASFPKKIHFPA